MGDKKWIWWALGVILVLFVLYSFYNWNRGRRYPDGKVSLIVPYAAGGGTDLLARKIADLVKEDFNNKIVVENRIGSGGAVGMIYGATQPADGRVITMVTVELAIEHSGRGGILSPGLFTPVLMLNSDYSVLTVSAESPFDNLEDFLAAARQNPLKIGNSGVGAIWHLASVALAKETGVSFNDIPFEGAAPAVTALLGGHIDATTVSYAEVANYVKAGDFKVLALMAPQRLPLLKEVPTAREQGYDVVVGTWRGLAVPKKTSDAIVGKISEIFMKAASSQAFLDFMADMGMFVDLLPSEDFEARIKADYKLFGELFQSLRF